MWNEVSAAQATGGSIQGKWQASRLSIDSRTVQSGDMFVAIKGERFDGHDYVAEALAKGASAALVSHIPEGCENAPLVIVPDVMKALIDMAVFNRARSNAVFIGVTGSVGKTGTKEALAIAFAAHGKVFATQGNFNNHIGLPLNLANMPLDAQFGIFEMGMNHAGEISILTRLVKPQIAIITTVEAVHLEFFESVEGIADAKAEIMEGLPQNGTIILNRDNRYFDRLKRHALARNISNIIAFGEHAESDVRLMQYQPHKSGSNVTALMADNAFEFTLGTIGKHWAMTALTVLAASLAASRDIPKTAIALAAFSEPVGRGKFYSLKVPSGSGEYTLIDDCYNASPASMEAGFSKLKELVEGMGGAHRRVVILGDMLELGIASQELHKGLASAIERAGIDAVFACGTWMKYLYDTLPPALKAAYADNAAQLLPLVQAGLVADDVALIKGSNGSNMKLIRDALKMVSNTKDFAHAV